MLINFFNAAFLPRINFARARPFPKKFPVPPETVLASNWPPRQKMSQTRLSKILTKLFQN